MLCSSVFGNFFVRKRSLLLAPFSPPLFLLSRGGRTQRFYPPCTHVTRGHRWPRRNFSGNEKKGPCTMRFDRWGNQIFFLPRKKGPCQICHLPLFLHIFLKLVYLPGKVQQPSLNHAEASRRGRPQICGFPTKKEGGGIATS